MQRVKREPCRRTTRKPPRAADSMKAVKLPYPDKRAADRAQLDDEGKPFFMAALMA